MKPTRWLVLGCSGAGKTTFALELGRILRLPVIHLDRHFWRPGWVEPRDEVWDRQVVELSGGDAWVMDGNYARTLMPRLERAEAAVLLDLPTLQCLGGVLRRSLRYRGRVRPDLAEGCPEQWPDLDFLRYVTTYRWRSRPRVLRRVRAAPDVKLHRLRSRAEVRTFLDGLRREVAGTRPGRQRCPRTTQTAAGAGPEGPSPTGEPFISRPGADRGGGASSRP